jgi:Flp pilus assembly protein TadG
MRKPIIRRRNERGSAFLELALVSTIMLPLFFGVLDYSRVFYFASQAQGAARAGTNFAIYDPPNHANVTGMENAATGDASNVTTPNSISANATYYCECYGTTTQVSCSSSCGSNSEMMEYAQVNTTLTFQTYFHYPLLPTTLTINGQSIMRVQ